MSTLVHEHTWPDRVVVGTLGAPGSRSFYLQVRTRSLLTSVLLEKQQAAVLAEKINEILDQLSAGAGDALTIPETTPVELVDDGPLEQPVEAAFRAGTMSLGWDPSTAEIVIEAYSVIEVDADDLDLDIDPASDIDLEPTEVVVVRMPVGTARAFAERTREIVGAGRPVCVLCGEPIDGDDHVCRIDDGL